MLLIEADHSHKIQKTPAGCRGFTYPITRTGEWSMSLKNIHDGFVPVFGNYFFLVSILRTDLCQDASQLP